jgi:fructokinase
MSMHDESKLVAGVELGGTKCIALLASGPEQIVEEVRFPTEAPEQTLPAIRQVLKRWHAHPGFAALGIAGFGPLELDERSPDFGRVTATPKPGWRGADLLSLAEGLDLPVVIDTDVNAAALAEGRWGAAQGLRSHAYITVGTGIGVGLIINGQSVSGLGHAEAGHLRVARLPQDEWPGVCPYHGDCVEGLASGPALAARSGRSGAELGRDDPAWRTVVHALAGLLHNLVLTGCPERILIGGGVVQGQPWLFSELRQALVESLGGYGVADRIAADVDRFVQPPELGARAGPLGAIALALDA